MSILIHGQSSTSSSTKPFYPLSTSSWLWRQILWLRAKQETSEFFKNLPSKLHLFHFNIDSLLPHTVESQEKERIFYEKALKYSQPVYQNFPLKKKMQTFNHVNLYVLQENIIWYKPLDNFNSSWQPIFFEGYSRGIIPEVIQADGANLIIMANQEIYYKKVLEESRDPLTQNYSFKDISSQNNWIPAWFTLPVLEYFQNPSADNHLKLPNDFIGFAISNRAAYCGKVEDALGIEHLNPLNVTSLYVLMKSGILLYDPYVNIGANFELPLPETKTSTFEGLSLFASGSTLLLIGYEIKPQEKGVSKTLEVLTCFQDHDLLGNNPEISYDFKVNAPNPKSFMLPMPGWIKHSRPGTIVKEGTIIQTGVGNQARELRIPGWNAQQAEGYFKKRISEKEWQFIPYPHGYSKAEALCSYLKENEQEFKTTIRDYPLGKLVSANLPSITHVSLCLCDFGKNTFSSTIQLQINELRLELLLYKTNGILNFIFPSLPPNYQLVLPPLDSLTSEQNAMIKTIFHPVTPVSVIEMIDSVKITPLFLTGLFFELNFKIN